MDKIVKMYSKTTEVTIHIGMGLPGSGKSTYFGEIAPVNSVFVPSTKTYKTLIDLDEIISSRYKKKFVTDKDGKLNIEKLFSYSTAIPSKAEKAIIVIDGLFLEKEPVLDVIRQLNDLVCEHFGPYNNYSYDVIIDQWEENRDQCLDNDLARNRTKDSSFTISNAKYERFAAEELDEFRKNEAQNRKSISSVQHKVAVPEEWQLVTNRRGCPNDVRFVRSEYWAIGGTCGSYTGKKYEIEPEEQKDNDFLDKFLEEHAPTISYLQYKRLVKECVEMKTEDFYDYYGGHKEEAYWETDMKKVYELIKEWNILK